VSATSTPPARPRSIASRAYAWLRGSSTGIAVLAVLVGLGAGLGAVVFRYLILWFTLFFSGHPDYSASPGEPHPFLPWLGAFFVVLAPVAGGLVYGPLVTRFAPEARGHGVPEVMLAVAERGGRIRPQVAVVKSLASALCIGSGGSVGREGPIVQIGSALGSTFGQVLRLPESRLRLLVACGAAGGISATFNAPIAGVFFALELILRDFEAELFGVVVLSSVAANVVGRAFFGASPFLTLPAFELVSYQEALLYLGLGALAAGAGLAFVRVLYGLEDVADKLWRGPEAIRPAVGGILLGLLLLAVPRMYGVGYPVLQDAIDGKIVLATLLLLLGAKVVATSLTIAIGGSGGVFAPSLFMGAMLGTSYGVVVNSVFPGLTAPPGAYGIVGMGAVFAGAARAPITAVLIIFELTGEYQIILPLMFAVALGAGVANLITSDTIYTLKLRRRGIDIRRGRGATLMELMRVRDAMDPVPPALERGLGLDAMVARFAEDAYEALPVVEQDGSLVGIVARSEVEESMRDNALDAVAGDLAQPVEPVGEDQTVSSALERLIHETAGLPVTGEAGALRGWLTHQGVLRAYHARLADLRGEAARAEPSGMRLPPIEDYRVVELTLSSSRPAGLEVRAVRWPPRSLLVAVQRNGKPFVPVGTTLLQDGDRLTVLLPRDHADDLADLLAADPHADPR
jgi:chloride channel protein, CIC family